MKELPLDRSRPFRESDYPRELSEYTPLRHFGQRFKEDDRFLTEEVIQACITEGDLRDNGDGCACFRKKWGEGVAYYLIAGFHKKGYLVLVTAWPRVHNREAALDSGMWSPEELDIIKEREEKLGRKKSFNRRFPEYSDWMQTA